MKGQNLQLPTKIKIGPHIFKIVFPFHFDHNKDLCGQIDTTVNEIRIEGANQGQDYVATNVWETLFHEIAHEVLKFAGFEYTETQVDIVASSVLGILIDNGWLEPELPDKGTPEK